MVEPDTTQTGVTTLKTNEFFASKALAALFAFTVSAVFMATAIVPASPIGLVA